MGDDRSVGARWRALRAGPTAVLLEVDDAGLVPVLAATATHRRDVGEFERRAEIVAGATTVLIDGLSADAATRLANAASDWTLVDVGAAPVPTVEIPVVYDGPDLHDVAVAWGMTTDEVRRTHAAIEFTVAFLGFAPGFAYLSGLPAELAVARLERPRERVPAGALAVADRYSAVYPQATPGGWRLLGRANAVLWDLHREPPALLQPGTVVRFVDVTERASGEAP